MAGKSLFGRSDDGDEGKGPDTSRGDATEGVRLLGAEEAAEVVERGETVKRRGRGKRYGDRPEPPPPDVKPAMRFPLADSDDPAQLDRPRPAPVPPPPPPVDDPVIRVEPPTGETELPHWTAPPTGEVPRVVIAGDDASDEAEAAKWRGIAGTAPRWRNQDDGWSDDEAPDLAHDEHSRLGALDESERPTTEEFLTFDDLEVPEAALPTAPPRGTAADPIRIRASGNRPEPPAGGTAARAARRGRTAAPERPDAPAGARSQGGEGPPGPRDRSQAIQVGLAIAGVCFVAFLVGGQVPWFMLLVTVPALVAAVAELFNASRRAGFRPLHLVGLVACAVLSVVAYHRGESGVVLVVVLTVVVCLALYLLGEGPGRPVANIAITLTGVLYVGVLGSFAGALLGAGPWANQVPAADPVSQGNWYLFLVAVGTVLHDAVGYLVGGRIGRRPLSAASPNKTVEGLAVGMAAAFFGVLLVGGLGLGVPGWGQAAVLGLVIAVVAPFGDLAESMIKRDLGVKDMGDALPSHGGVLDRFDGFLFTLPAAYYTLLVLGLIG